MLFGRFGYAALVRLRARDGLAALVAVACLPLGCAGEPQSMLEQFPVAAQQVMVVGATLSTIDCEVDKFVIGGLGGPGASGEWAAPEKAADSAVERYSIRVVDRLGPFGSHESTLLFTYVDSEGRPLADVRVQRLGDGWDARGIQACKA